MRETRVEVVNLLLTNESAQDFFERGCAARDREEISTALIAFLTAFRMDGSRNDAAFEIARLFLAWDEIDIGWTWLGHAVDAGYWSEERMRQDSLLAPLRQREGYRQLAARVRENYAKALPELRGQTLVRRPQGEAPAGGWPVLLCMHGYGTDHNDLSGLLEVGSAQGFLAISVAGYRPVSPGRHAWPNEGPAIHAYLQGVLKPYRQDPSANTDLVYTAGFSQGGLVATYLVSVHPELYSGAVPISPGGPLTVPRPADGKLARPLFLVYGSAEGPGVHGNVRRFRQGVEAAGGRAHVEVHGGGHVFPDNWREVFARGLNFVQGRDDE
ncbi:MAG: hypothetical protein GY711_06155 [bacterium]|nr:hypothetical protein [bacterium]